MYKTLIEWELNWESSVLENFQHNTQYSNSKEKRFILTYSL